MATMTSINQLSEKDRILLDYLYRELEQIKKNHGGSDKVYIRNVRLFLGLDEEATIDNICRALDELKGEQIEVHNLLSSLETKVALDVNKITKIYELFYDALAKKG